MCSYIIFDARIIHHTPPPPTSHPKQKHTNFSVLTKGAIFSKTWSGIKQLVGYTRKDQNAKTDSPHLRTTHLTFFSVHRVTTPAPASTASSS